ncbi:MAG TPA: hypothetical protein VFQ40_07390 [Actinomycetota bacterium]|nr:hypothetical protein [Actinomycetota bacterium]
MKNVTVTLDDETARWVRIEAARRDESVSSLLREPRRFLIGEEAVTTRAPSSRSLATVLFTDVVGSTEHVAKLGDDRRSPDVGARVSS